MKLSLQTAPKSSGFLSVEKGSLVLSMELLEPQPKVTDDVERHTIRQQLDGSGLAPVWISLQPNTRGRSMR